MIGTRLRQARQTRRLSLNDVAAKAEISVATLSRIERDQQRIDVELLLQLMNILRLDAGDVFGEQPRQEPEVEPIVERIASLPPEKRAKLWRSLSNARTTKRRERARALALQMDEFLAQIDLLRNQLEGVRKQLASTLEPPDRPSAHGRRGSLERTALS